MFRCIEFEGKHHIPSSSCCSDGLDRNFNCFMFSTFNSRHHLRLSAPSKSCKYSRRCMHLENHRQFHFQHDQSVQQNLLNNFLKLIQWLLVKIELLNQKSYLIIERISTFCFILSKSKMRRSKFITDFQILHQTLAGSLTPKLMAGIGAEPSTRSSYVLILQNMIWNLQKIEVSTISKVRQHLKQSLQASAICSNAYAITTSADFNLCRP